MLWPEQRKRCREEGGASVDAHLASRAFASRSIFDSVSSTPSDVFSLAGLPASAGAAVSM